MIGVGVGNPEGIQIRQGKTQFEQLPAARLPRIEEHVSKMRLV